MKLSTNLIIEAGRYFKQHDYNKALDCYEMAVAMDPTDVVPWRGVIVIYRLLKDDVMALRRIERAIEENPEEFSFWFLRGLIFEEDRQEYYFAIDCYEQAVKLGYKDHEDRVLEFGFDSVTDFYTAVTRVLSQKLGVQVPITEQEFKTMFVETNPKAEFKEILNRLVKLYYLRSDYSKAKEFCKKVLQMDNTDQKALEFLAKIKSHVEIEQERLNDLQEAALMEEINSKKYWQVKLTPLAEKFQISSKVMEEYLQKIADQDPKFYYDAESEILTNIQLESTVRTVVNLYYESIQSNWSSDKIHILIKDLERAAALDPYFSEAWYMLGGLYNTLGDTIKASKCFSRLLDSNSRWIGGINSRMRKINEEGGRHLAILGLLENLKIPLDPPKIQSIDVTSFRKPLELRTQTRVSPKKKPQRKLIKAYPGDFKKLIDKALKLKDSGDLKNAIECCEQILRTRTNHEPVRKILSEITNNLEGQKLCGFCRSYFFGECKAKKTLVDFLSPRAESCFFHLKKI